MLRHSESHRSHRIGWLRAAVLGANDGIVSTASLLIGVAYAGASQQTLVITGLAGLVSGAMAMAAGEYVSVSSQSDTESADLAKERHELATEPEHELDELTGIYIKRGLTKELAREVAIQMTEHDAFKAHARDELGINEMLKARPVQAAITSAITFAAGAALPLMVAWFSPYAQVSYAIAIASLIFLAALGGLAARTGGASQWKGAWRVTLWGALAMVATAAVGHLFGVAVG